MTVRDNPTPFILDAWFMRCIKALSDWLDTLIARRGARLGSAIVAALLLGGAMVYVRPSFFIWPLELVGTYTWTSIDIARDPFNYDWHSSLRGYRIFVPLISYLIGLRGELITITNALIVYAFIFVLFYKYLTDSGSALLAFAVASALTFTAPVLYNVYDLASVDTARALLMMLMVWYAHKRILFWLLFLAALFTHEGTIPFLPFFLLLRWPHRRSHADFAVDVVLGAICVGVMLPFYGKTGGAGGSSYLGAILSGPSAFLENTFRWVKEWAWAAYDNLFSGLKLMYLVILGGLILCIIERNYYRILLLLAPVGGVFAMLLIGADVTRYTLFCFLSLLLAIDYLRERYGDRPVAHVLLLVGGFNLFVPQQVSWGGPPGSMNGLFNTLMFLIF